MSGCGGVCAGYSSVRLVNSILWDDHPAPLGDEGEALLDVTFSDVEGGAALPGEGNISTDPLFASSGAFDFERFTAFTVDGVEFVLPDFIVEAPDYTLSPGSPAIDSGTAQGAPATDLEGRGRPCGAAVDLGVYEAGSCPASGRSFRRADSNADGALNISDPISLLGYLFLGGAAPPCLDAADADDSGDLAIADAICSLAFQFTGGAAPTPPFPGCGPDLWIDGLGCEAYPGCE